MKKRKLLAAFACTAAALTGCSPFKVIQMAQDMLPSSTKEAAAGGTAKEASEAKAETTTAPETTASNLSTEEQINAAFETYANQNQLVRLSPKTQLDFSYKFEMESYGSNNSSWYARPSHAELSDCLISTYQKDLNHDGVPELLALSVQGSRQSGNGANNLYLDVFSWNGSTLDKAGCVYFSDCFGGSNDEQYLLGIKDVGDRSLIYAGSSSLVYTWADGSSPAIRLYSFNGQTVSSVWEVSTSGSDWSWMDDWQSQLRSYGFDVFGSGQYGDWMPYQLAGESGFEVLLYADCATVINKQAAFAQGGTEGTQQYILQNGYIQGSIFGTNSPQILASVIASGQSTTVAMTGQGSTAAAGSSGTGTAVGNGSQAIASGGYNNNPVYVPPVVETPAPTQPVQQYTGNSSYTSGQPDDILPQSSTQYITRADLYGLDKAQLRIARNEIYARHGRIFDSEDLRVYFNSKPWYHGTIDKNHFSDVDMLSKLERENIKVIQSME